MPHDAPKPPGYTRFVCVSDTHSRTDPIQMPYGDVLIHAGDFTELGLPSEVKKFNEWLGRCRPEGGLPTPPSPPRPAPRAPCPPGSLLWPPDHPPSPLRRSSWAFVSAPMFRLFVGTFDPGDPPLKGFCPGWFSLAVCPARCVWYRRVLRK